MCAWGAAGPVERAIAGTGREGEAWEEPAACAYKREWGGLLHVVGWENCTPCIKTNSFQQLLDKDFP